MIGRSKKTTKRLVAFFEISQSPRFFRAPEDTSPQKMSALRTASAPMSEEMTFYRRERAQLVTLGITDYDDQSRELARRWKAIVDARARNVQRQSQMIYAQQPLTDAQCRATNMRFVRMDTSSGTVMFVYTIVPKSAPARPVLLEQPKRARSTSSGLGELLTSARRSRRTRSSR
jgi:hypothetical protein